LKDYSTGIWAVPLSEAARDTDQEVSASFDQEGGADWFHQVVCVEIGARIGIARHAVKSAESGRGQDVA
jgi:hypothetical protein